MEADTIERLKEIVRNEVRELYHQELRNNILTMIWWYFDQQTRNIEWETQRRALHATAEVLGDKLMGLPTFTNRFDLLAYAIGLIPRDGIIAEFGVAEGASLAFLCTKIHDRTVYGFDSFEGLPENWRTGFPKGTFKPAKAITCPDNAVLVTGLFADTLPFFWEERSGESCAFIHIDCDLYSSTKDIFINLRERIVPGTVIVFDEYCNYPGWQDHEYKAFQEFVAETKLEYAYVGYVRTGFQVAVVVTATPPDFSKKSE